jgi:hypothetical protein
MVTGDLMMVMDGSLAKLPGEYPKAIDELNCGLRIGHGVF